MRDEQIAIHLKIAKMDKAIKWRTCALFILLLLAIAVVGFIYSSHMQIIAEVRRQLALIQRECRSNITLLLYQQQQSKKQLQEYFKDQKKNAALLLQQQDAIKGQISSLSKGQLEKWQENKKQITSLHQKNEGLAQSQKRIEESHAKEIKSLAYQLRISDSIGHHPANSHKIYYSIIPTSASSAKIERIGQNGWYSFINKFAIFRQADKIRYQVKIGKQFGSFLVGFTTEKGLGVIDNSHSPEAVYYWNYKNGTLFVQGKTTSLFASQLNVEGIFDVGVDFMARKFEWLKNGTKLAECNIPKSMDQKPFYLSIIMYGINNEVEVFT